VRAGKNKIDKLAADKQTEKKKKNKNREQIKTRQTTTAENRNRKRRSSTPHAAASVADTCFLPDARV